MSYEKEIQELRSILENHTRTDCKKLADEIPFVAAALRKEGLSKGQVRAALLSICGVRVGDSLVKHLMLFQ